MILSELRSTAREVANVDVNRLPSTILNSYLNLAQADIMDLYRLRFGEAYITTAFTLNTQTINPSITTGVVVAPTALWFQDSSGERADVEQITAEEYFRIYGTAPNSDDSTGDPVHFAIYGESDLGHPTLYLGPIPTASRTAYMTARIRFNDLSADADENQLTRRAPLAVIYRALEIAAGYLESPERIPEWQRVVSEQMKRLLISHGAARYSAKFGRSMQEPG